MFRHRRRTASMALMLAAFVLASSGCARENTISADNEHQVTSAIEKGIPGAKVDVIDPSGDDLMMSYALKVTIRVDSEDFDQAREYARRTAHIVWDIADVEWEHLRIDVWCPSVSMRNPVSSKCPNADLMLTPTAAHNLWGEPEHVDHNMAGDGNPGFDYERAAEIPKGWSFFKGPRAHERDGTDWWTIYLPDGVPQAERDKRLDAIEAMLWRNEPYPIRRLGLEVTEQTDGARVAPENNVDTRRHWTRHRTADELRAKHGPRAPDLER